MTIFFIYGQTDSSAMLSKVSEWLYNFWVKTNIVDQPILFVAGGPKNSSQFIYKYIIFLVYLIEG